VHTNKFQLNSRQNLILVELTHYHPRLALTARLNLSLCLIEEDSYRKGKPNRIKREARKEHPSLQISQFSSLLVFNSSFLVCVMRTHTFGHRTRATNTIILEAKDQESIESHNSIITNGFYYKTVSQSDL